MTRSRAKKAVKPGEDGALAKVEKELADLKAKIEELRDEAGLEAEATDPIAILDEAIEDLKEANARDELEDIGNVENLEERVIAFFREIDLGFLDTATLELDSLRRDFLRLIPGSMRSTL